MTTATSSKTFLVSVFFALHGEWRELDLFESKTDRISLSRKLSGIFPSGVKSRKKVLAALKASLDGHVHEVKTSAGLLRIHSW